MDRDPEDGSSYWLLIGGRKYSVQAGEFWKLCEGAPLPIVVLEVDQEGHERRPTCRVATLVRPLSAFEVVSIGPADEPRPPVVYDLRPAAQGGWLFGVGLRQWWFRSGEVMTRTPLAHDWTRLAHPRLRIEHGWVGGGVKTTLQAWSDGGT